MSSEFAYTHRSVLNAQSRLDNNKRENFDCLRHSMNCEFLGFAHVIFCIDRLCGELWLTKYSWNKKKTKKKNLNGMSFVRQSIIQILLLIA